MRNLLNITCGRGADYFGTTFLGYIVEGGLAHRLAGFDTMDRAREWASENGFDGLLIGGPSMAWAN